MPINFNELNIGDVRFGDIQIAEVRWGETLVWPPPGDGTPIRAHGWANEFTASNASRAALGLWTGPYQREIVGEPSSYCFNTSSNPGNYFGPPYSGAGTYGGEDGTVIGQGSVDVPGWYFGSSYYLMQEIYTGDATQEDSLMFDYNTDLTAYDNYMTVAVNTQQHPNSQVQPVTFQLTGFNYLLGTFGYVLAHGVDAPTAALIGTFFNDLWLEVQAAGGNDTCYYYLTMGNADGVNAFNGFVSPNDTANYGDTFTTEVTTVDAYLYSALNIDLSGKKHYITEQSAEILNVVTLSRDQNDPYIQFSFDVPYPDLQREFFNFRFTRESSQLILDAADFTTVNGIDWRVTDSRIWTTLLNGSAASAPVPFKIEYTPI